jgi:GT2 family glycosyltransferase
VRDSTFLTAYQLIDDEDNVPFNFFYTSNISLPKEEILKIGLFDEDFEEYGLEDIEFGYRWRKAGYRIRFNPKAVGHHIFDLSKEEFLKRRYMVGRAAVLFYKKHKSDPSLKEYLHIDVAERLTPKSELIIERANSIIEMIEGLPLDDEVFGTKGILNALHSCYSLLVAYHYYLGIRDGLLKT